MNITTITDERSGRYGSFECNAKLTSALMQALECHPDSGSLTEVHWEALHMIMHKVSRMVCGDNMYADNPIDIAGYARCLAMWMEENNAKV